MREMTHSEVRIRQASALVTRLGPGEISDKLRDDLLALGLLMRRAENPIAARELILATRPLVVVVGPRATSGEVARLSAAAARVDTAILPLQPGMRRADVSAWLTDAVFAAGERNVSASALVELRLRARATRG
jgi:hypothetical protein